MYSSIFEQDARVSVIAKAQPNTIVVVVAPGAALMPWSNEAKAIIHMFMPGLEMGHALADVLSAPPSTLFTMISVCKRALTPSDVF